MNNIDIFYNSEIILRKKSFKIKYYMISMFILIGALFIFITFFEYTSYINLKAIVKKDNDGYYLKTLIQEQNFNDINKNYLIINDKKYKYKIKNISEGYILDENYNKYYEVLLEKKINSNLIIDNNIVDINIEKNKTTILKQIIEKIKKGMR